MLAIGIPAMSFGEIKALGRLKPYPFSIDAFNALATEKLGFEISVKNGLKICDFRPAFGHIFSEYLIDYEFWGYSDTDIIFGKLDNFITNELLDEHDFMSVREEYPSGFFAIYRNNEFVNTLFRQSESYREHFLKNHNALFEECGGYYHDVVVRGINILDIDCPFDTIHHLLERHKNKIRCFYKNLSIEDTTGNISLVDGKLTFSGKEVMMYHLSKFKKNYLLKLPDLKISGQNLNIFKHSLRKRSVSNYLAGRWHDFICRFSMVFSMFIDSKLKRVPEIFNIIGDYRYMRAIVKFTNMDNRPVILFDGVTIHIYKSLLKKNLFYIYKVNAYLDIRKEDPLTVIFKDGDHMVLTKE